MNDRRPHDLYREDDDLLLRMPEPDRLRVLLTRLDRRIAPGQEYTHHALRELVRDARVSRAAIDADEQVEKAVSGILALGPNATFEAAILLTRALVAGNRVHSWGSPMPNMPPYERKGEFGLATVETARFLVADLINWRISAAHQRLQRLATEEKRSVLTYLVSAASAADFAPPPEDEPEQEDAPVVEFAENTRFFKATRADGTDFYSGQVSYAGAPGTVITHPMDGTPHGIDLDHPETYFGLSTEPAQALQMDPVSSEDLEDVMWPCRLFQVQPVGPVAVDEKSTLVGAQKLVILQELPGWSVLGPRGLEVEAIIRRAGTLTADEMHAMHDLAHELWGDDQSPRQVDDGPDEAAWVSWRYDARRVASKLAMTAVFRELPTSTPFSPGDDLELERAWEVSAHVASEAAVAEAVRDRLSIQQYELMTGPWRRGLGRNA